jgi:hypothetical protein
MWISLTFSADVVLGGGYIPTTDSDYSDAALLGSIQAKMMKKENGLPILVGDLNARVWNVDRLNALWPEDSRCHYAVDEQVTSLNEQGRKVLQMCKDTKCAIVNHLQLPGKQFAGGLVLQTAKSLYL